MLRPRLAISGFTTDAYVEAIQGKRVFINVKISNSGGMPAYGATVESWIEFLERGPKERPFTFTPNAVHHTGAILNVDTANPQTVMVPLNRCLTQDEIYKMREAQGTLCFRIRLEYLAFGEKVYTDHGFEMQPGKAHDLDEYTSST